MVSPKRRRRTRRAGSPRRQPRFDAGSACSVAPTRSCMRSPKRAPSKLGPSEEHYAASTGQVGWLQICLQKAESPTQADINGFSALHMAALYGRLDCMQMLIEKFKVDVDLASVTGWRPIHLVLSKECGGMALECLQYLIKQEADINVQNQSGVSPLHKAASEGREKCLRLLIHAGANVHIKDNEGQKPIDLCKMWGHRSCAKYISSAMWKADKAHFAREVIRLKQIKIACEMRKKEFLKREEMEIDFCNNLAFEQWLEKKHLPAPPHKILHCLDNRRKSVVLRKATGKKISPVPSLQEVLPREITDIYTLQKDRRCRPWNFSTNLSSVPVTHIFRHNTVRLGVHPEKPLDPDFTSFLFLFKNAFGETEIQIDNMGKVLPVPDLPFEVIKKSLFSAARATRLDVPKDLRPLHIFNLQHKRQLGFENKWTDQMALSLRQTADPAFRGTLETHLATYSDPNMLSPRLGSDRAICKDSSSSTQSNVSSCQD
ncbi:ankyrin repeat domain-containing protein 53 isoform X2 [Rhineura floridana]|uniref:ankyrin repeat domain-containing protein 53 isoform X2 n=2 Tax=Rhineura floridana TaxID=261503 RepID=UPI002AC88DF3|nr:ankyrin repeat domain-containing protein 53 isoform X2 [Rhineura floridana]